MISSGTSGASMAFGGDGDDTITLSTAGLLADKKAHTITGGAGNDSIKVAGVGSEDLYTFNADPTLLEKDFRAAANTSVLSYAKSADFIADNKLVDNIVIVDDGGADTGKYGAVAEIGEALNITATVDFSNSKIQTGGANGARNSVQEGLLIKTASSVTAASTVVLGATAAEGIRGVDLSAGTTSNSSINAAADTTSVGLTLIGGKGKNTITGSKGGDVLLGNAQDDILTGGDGGDRITTGDGRDNQRWTWQRHHR